MNFDDQVLNLEIDYDFEAVLLVPHIPVKFDGVFVHVVVSMNLWVFILYLFRTVYDSGFRLLIICILQCPRRRFNKFVHISFRHIEEEFWATADDQVRFSDLYIKEDGVVTAISLSIASR